MRQGKSTLLQQLSGLTDREIPAQKGAACTAVRSIIYHHDGDTKVNVIFHSEKSLLEEVIQQYWKSLNLPNCPDSLDSFDRSPLPIPTTAVERSMYKNLLEYKDHLGKYRPLLAANRPNKESIAVDEISKYVTHQRNGEQELVSCEFLAVKQVEIYCRLKQLSERAFIVLNHTASTSENLDDCHRFQQAPVKCEAYMSDEKNRERLYEDTNKGYKELINFFHSHNIDFVIAPVQTVGSVIFSYIQEKEGEPQFFYRKRNSSTNDYNPQGGEQLLQHLLRFILSLHLQKKRWKFGLEWLQNKLDRDREFKEAIEQLADSINNRQESICSK